MEYSFAGPPLSRQDALFLAGLVSSSYVVSVYVSLLIAKPRPPMWRNDPAVIKARSILASLSTVLCCVLVSFTIWSNLPNKTNVLRSTVEHLGLPLKSLVPSLESLKPYMIVPFLFLGPLYATFLGDSLPFQRDWSFEKDLVPRFSTWEGVRNYVMAPITEEVTYRACVLSMYKLAGYSKNTMVWAAPCWFGMAHIHHAFETYKRLGKTPSALHTALISTVFQFAYTTVFGWLCSFLFLRTGSIFVPITAHIFCNIMGFPQITWELRQFPGHKLSIIFFYLAGIILFCCTLFPWTFNPNSLYWPAQGFKRY
ncbi:hypothetical protein M0805_007208 [Coniferiporia weirii]|nr:hypothetical protein M0805_007208 [Coniferiporia weirii]